MVKPKLNIFEKIKNRLIYKFDKILENKYDGKIYYYDSLKIRNILKDNSIDLVVTSPPYLNLINYSNSNWIRLWLLGYDRKNVNKELNLSDKFLFNNYIEFIKKYLIEIYPSLKENANVCLVVGDVGEINLIEKVWLIIKNDIPYEFVEIYYDTNYSQNKKVTNMLGRKKGKSTKIEKVLVVKKS